MRNCFPAVTCPSLAAGFSPEVSLASSDSSRSSIVSHVSGRFVTLAGRSFSTPPPFRDEVLCLERGSYSEKNPSIRAPGTEAMERVAHVVALAAALADGRTGMVADYRRAFM